MTAAESHRCPVCGEEKPLDIEHWYRVRSDSPRVRKQACRSCYPAFVSAQAVLAADNRLRHRALTELGRRHRDEFAAILAAELQEDRP